MMREEKKWREMLANAGNNGIIHHPAGVVAGALRPGASKWMRGCV